MPHTSPSQLGMYSRCPAQYEFRYIQEIIRAPGIALPVGSGVHGGAEVAMRQKIESHVDLKANDVADAAVAKYDGLIEADGVSLTPEESTVGFAKTVGQNRDRVVSLAVCWAAESQPLYQPTDVEVRFTIPSEAEIGRDLVGIADMADDQRRVIDWKTGARKLPQRDADTSIQLTAYALWYWRQFGKTAKCVGFDQLVSGKTGVIRHFVGSTRTHDDYVTFWNRARGIIGAIEAGSFPPCDPGHWCCSTRFCGYTDICPHFIKEK